MIKMDKEEVRNLLITEIKKAEIVEHPDTPNSYAAYQVNLSQKFEIWVNARNGLIVAMQRKINRL